MKIYVNELFENYNKIHKPLKDINWKACENSNLKCKAYRKRQNLKEKKIFFRLIMYRNNANKM